MATLAKKEVPSYVRNLPATQAIMSDYQELKFTLHRKLLDRINLETLSLFEGDRVRAEIRTAVSRLVDEEKPPPPLVQKTPIIDETLNHAFRLRPLQPPL